MRLVWSESDGLPGLIIDRYADVLVVQTLTMAMYQRLGLIKDILGDLFNPRSIIVPSPTSHSARLERAFSVFTPKFSGHAVSGSNGVLSSIIKAQSDGTPVG